MPLFQTASKVEAKLRMALHGPAGSGKTRSALEIGKALAGGDIAEVYVLDTEHGSATKEVANVGAFTVCELKPPYHPDSFVEAMVEAGKLGARVIIVDSATHLWKGPGGCLDLVATIAKREAARRGGKPDDKSGWREVDPLFDKFVLAMLNSPAHVIVTCRAKMKYDYSDGKVRKIGLEPEIRDNFVYATDVEGLLDADHNLVIGKTRCSKLDGKVFHRPGQEVADICLEWLAGQPAPAEVPSETRPDPILQRLSICQSEDDVQLVINELRKLSADKQKEYVDAVRAKRAAIRGA